MNELNEIRQRILTALSVVEAGVGRLSAEPAPEPPPEPVTDGEAPDPARLAAELAEERTLTAQLEERIRALKEKQDHRLAALDDQIMAQRAQLAALDGELQALRQTNADLRDVAAQMREALTEGVAEPELVNRAMMAEIEALRATRAADRAEVEAVLGALEPLIREQG